MNINELVSRGGYKKAVDEEFRKLMKDGYVPAEIMDMELPTDFIEGEHVVYASSGADELLDEGVLVNATDFKIAARVVGAREAFGTRVFRDVFNNMAEPEYPFYWMNRVFANPDVLKRCVPFSYIKTQSVVDYIDGRLNQELFLKHSAKAKLVVRAVVYLDEVEEEVEALKADAEAKAKELLR
jgi:hypothetical protein